jgi:E2/UBC family protein E
LNNGVTDSSATNTYIQNAVAMSHPKQNNRRQRDKGGFMAPKHLIHIFINKKKYELEDPVQTGASLKQLAGIPLSDVLFLQRPHEDDHLHSQPPADYGLQSAILTEAGLDPARATLHNQPEGWTFLVISEYALPAEFQPARVDVLIKLPPGFPDAAPDMFWVYPPVRTLSGSLPRATSEERLLGKTWQRFSWHLAAGAWKPGVSDLREFLRCIHSRFLQMD